MVTFPTGTDPERPGLQPTKPSRMARPAQYERGSRFHFALLDYLNAGQFAHGSYPPQG
jgi:hypothetical protein